MDQESVLADYADSRANTVARLMAEARAKIESEILSLDPDDVDTVQRLRKLLKDIDRVKRELEEGIFDMGTSDEYIGKLVSRQASEGLSIVSGSTLTLGLDDVNSRTIALFSQNELDKVGSIAQTAIQELKSDLMTEIGIKGRNPRAVAKDIFSRYGVRQSTMQTIVRTESSTIYNAQHLESIHYANKIGVEMRKKITEHIDLMRNHPISLVTDGLVQEYDAEFKVKESDVIDASKRVHSRTRSRLGIEKSIFWRKEKGIYVGNNLPAHYNERGRIVPTRSNVNNLIE